MISLCQLNYVNCVHILLQKELYVLIDKLRQIAMGAEVTTRLVGHGKDGRNERLATRK